jgi:hypothetical protein
METEKEIQRDADHCDAMAVKNDGNKRLAEWTPQHKVVFGATRSGKSEAIGSLLARVGHKLRELNEKPSQKKKKQRRSAG